MLEQDLFDDLLGGGLILVANGDVWKRHRDMLLHGFHQNSLSLAVGDIGRRTIRFFNEVPTERVIDAQDLLQHLTFNIMCYFALGVETDEIDTLAGKKDHHYHHHSQGCSFTLSVLDVIETGLSVADLWYFVLDHTQKRFIAPFRTWDYYLTEDDKKYNVAMATLRAIINKGVDKELAGPSKGEEEGVSSLLTFMVQEHKNNPEAFTRKNIVQHALTFLFAGHDTTTNLASFMFYHIGLDPNIKAQCVAEVDELFAGKGPDELPTMKDIKAIRYLRMVAKETLRLYPGAPLRGRDLREEVTFNGVKFPPTAFLLDFLSVHLDPEYWPNPEVFDPERFSEEQEKSRSAPTTLSLSAPITSHTHTHTSLFVLS